MPVGCVALTPAVAGDPVVARWDSWSAAAAAALDERGIAAVRPTATPTGAPPDASDWVAGCAVALLGSRPPGPLLLVAGGAAGALLPGLGFAQRAARRPVGGYLLVDAALPPTGATDWPDAPVVVVLPAGSADAEERSREARRRGWEVLVTDDVPGTIASVAARP